MLSFNSSFSSVNETATPAKNAPMAPLKPATSANQASPRQIMIDITGRAAVM